VRIPNPRLTRIASLTRGAIVEPGDGEIIISPELYNQVTISGPINVATGPATGAPWQDDSFLVSTVGSANGASAGVTTTMVGVKAGYWEFYWTVSFMFNGTTDLTKASSLAMVDPDGTAAGVSYWHHITGRQVNLAGFITPTLQRDGWLFRHTRDTTIVGDICAFHAQIMGLRIL
jgi:hypothetical protein